MAYTESKIHASRDIKLWYGHSYSLRHGAIILHAAAATHACPLVAACLLLT